MPDEEREQALVEAIGKYGKFVFWYLNQKSDDHAFVDDVAQIFWKHVYERFPVEYFDRIGYLKRKLEQVLIDELRKRKVREFVSYEEDPYESAHPDSLRDQREVAEEPQFYEQFWERFQTLDIPETHKQIFWYHHRYGYTIKEISQMLQVAPSTAHDWLKLVKSRCLDYLNNENDV